MHHVKITSQYWNDFVATSKNFEGCYCSLACITLALVVVKKSHELNQALSNRDNAIFDLEEYGKAMSSSFIIQKYNNALEEIQEARRGLNNYMKKFQEKKCKKI